MTKRTPIPPADVLFSGAQRDRPRAAPQPAPEPDKHVKVTYYMPRAMVADLDALRVDLQRAGARVDRGQLVRAAIRLAQQDIKAWSAAAVWGEESG